MRKAAFVFACLALFAVVRYGSIGKPEPMPDQSSKAWQIRERAIQRARVFVPAEFQAFPGFPVNRPVRCTFVPKGIRGTTPKFDCRLANGEVVKVKYGANPEVPAEIGATRLLAAFGFGADHVSHVDDVECAGCPMHPFRTRQLAEMLFAADLFEGLLNFNQVRHFDHVAIERKFEATPIKVGDFDGWEWSDLSHVDESAGGASRAELDALRLIAVVLGHWDNKPSNQRLVCLDDRRDDDRDDQADGAECARPLLMLQDLGASFGPRKLNHAKWTRTPLFESPEGCTATMASLPYNGATFRRVDISDAGRRLFVERARRLSDSQLTEIFRGAGFPDPATGERRADDVSPWVETLKKKIAEIESRTCEG